ncbi:[protein-PII] uridylyltransferase [Verticiella sediminum]|nr:[protein-PII] uridylyltransferase [Verticiella sediminum]
MAARIPASPQPAADLPALREQMRAERDQITAVFRENLRPDAFLGSLRRLVDRVLGQLLTIHPLPAGAALAAVGGYGRGELYPYSDVDILILLPHPAQAEEEAAISDLLTAMWDLGLEPGHSVRTIEDCLAEAAADITVETALLEARWLAGSRSLMRQFSQRMRERMNPAAFIRTKKLEMQQRHTRYENTPYALEPNCKESPGGLRDLQVILWMARAAGLGRTWKQVADAGLLTSQEARQLRRAEQAFKRLRIELHLLAGRREDRVLFEHQPALAEAYGIEGAHGRRASEMLMQRYYWAAKLVTQLNNILVQNIEERMLGEEAGAPIDIDDDFVNRHGKLDIRLDDAFERKPALLLKAFLVMQQHAELSGMSVRTVRAIWHARRRIDAQFRANPVNRHMFLAILQQPRGIVHELRRMNDLGVLPAYLPPFRRIVGQMQHDLFHVYTVDQHTLMVVRNLRRFTMDEHAHEYPLCSDLIANFDRHWLLYLAALFHDIAKGRGGDHSRLGAIEVRRFARTHQLDKGDAQLVEFLVREHLLLSSVAQKQDLSDPQVIRAFAERVGTERHLTALYLLTVADIRGTSPKVWNSWKGKLLEDLYRKTLDALGGGVAPNATTLLALRKQEAASLLRLAGLRDDARDTLWRELDVGYFLRNDASDIAWHTRHLYNKVRSETPVVRARAIEGESLQFAIYAKNTPALFTQLCAWFESRRLGILDARIHTTRHGYALDSFVVLSPSGAGELRTIVSVLEHELADYLRQTGPAQSTPPANLGRASRRSRQFPVTPAIELHPDESGKSWILSLSATDRAGLLHAIARIFGEHGVTVSSAKVMTLGERVEDVFVLDGGSGTLGDSRSQLRFERELLDTLRT